MIIAYIILIIVAIIFHARSKKDNNSGYTLLGITSSVIAVVILTILICTSKDTTGIGKYTYYVNGAKVSSGFVATTENISLSLIFGMISILGSGIIGYKLAKILPKKFKGSTLSLILYIIVLVFGIIFAYSGITGLIHTSKALMISNITSIVVGLFLIYISIRGFIEYRRSK